VDRLGWTFLIPTRLSEDRVRAALSALGWQVGGSTPCRRHDTLVDTQDGRLARAGLQLRRCRERRRWELFGAGELLVERGTAAGPARGAVARRVAEVAGEARLLPLLEVRGTGRAVRLDGPGGPVDAAFETWRLCDPLGRRAEKELRVLTLARSAGEPAARLAESLRQLAGLEPLADVVAEGLRRLGLPRPGAPLPPELRVTAADPPPEVVRKVLARQAFALRTNVDGAALDLDPEFVHDLRVATRRSRAALRLFRPLLDEECVAALRAELTWAAGALGAVRDLHVLLDRLRGQLARTGVPRSAARWVLGRLERERRAAQAALVETLRSPRFAAIVAALDAVEASPPDGWPATAAEWGAAAIRRASRRVERWQPAAGEPTAAELHRLRIAFKRFRYTCEFFADPLGEEVRAAIRELVRFQDILGAHQDAVVALHRLDGLVAAAAGAGARPALLVALGALQQVQREEAIGRRDAFAKAWPRLPKRLRRLRRGLRRPGSDDEGS
jgi:CHAD domain-containing protein